MKEIKLQMVAEDVEGFGNEKVIGDTPAKVANLMSQHIGNSPREFLYAIYLDAKNVVTGIYLVGAGTADRAPCSAREVFGPAILCNALKIILAHNHPSGDVQPSPADLKLTRHLAEVGRQMDIPIVDHVIVGFGGEWYSLQENGYV